MEFRPMRRQDRQLSQEEVLAILERETDGVLALSGDEGWPYAVPSNYIFWNGSLYLHGAREGHKMDSIVRDDRVCFTVVSRRQLVPQHITTLYESVVVFGTASVVEDEAQRQAVLEALVDRLAEVSPDLKARYIRSKEARTGLIRIQPTHITGKANQQYVPVTKRM